jgi:hypothetical protein
MVNHRICDGRQNRLGAVLPGAFFTRQKLPGPGNICRDRSANPSTFRQNPTREIAEFREK